jgi:hypothetical protein
VPQPHLAWADYWDVHLECALSSRAIGHILAPLSSAQHASVASQYGTTQLPLRRRVILVEWGRRYTNFSDGNRNNPWFILSLSYCKISLFY